MANAKLEYKLLERRARAFADSLQGIARADVRRALEGEFAWHEQQRSAFRKIDAKPNRTWPVSVTMDRIGDWISDRLKGWGFEAFVPYEKDLLVSIVVADYRKLVNGLWSARFTTDAALFFKAPAVVVELQDLEHEVAYFEAISLDGDPVIR